MLERWFDAFGRDRVLVEISEEMYADPQVAVDAVFDGLGCPGTRLDGRAACNAEPSPGLDPGLRRELTERLAPRVAATEARPRPPLPWLDWLTRAVRSAGQIPWPWRLRNLTIRSADTPLTTAAARNARGSVGERRGPAGFASGLAPPAERGECERPLAADPRAVPVRLVANSGYAASRYSSASAIICHRAGK